MKKRVLTFYITNRSGHHKAALAVEKSLHVLDAECETFTIDLVKYLHPISSWVINKIYSLIIKRFPFIWGNMYDKPKVYKSLAPFHRFVSYCDLNKLKKIIDKLNPDVVVCTQAFPCSVVADYKNRYDGKFKLIGVVTDFWANRFWFNDNVDQYVISSDWCEDGFEKAGISKNRLARLGIPISPDFINSYDLNLIGEQFDLKKNIPTVLIMGGGSGIGPLSKVTALLDSSVFDFQMVVICGKNKKLFRSFKRKRFKKNVKVFPYIDEVYKLMEFSDIIITKPGGITVSEALCKHLGLVVLTPIPGQEGNNLKFLLDHKLCLKAANPNKVLKDVEFLLKDKAVLEGFKKRAFKFSNSSSAIDVGNLILKNTDG